MADDPSQSVADPIASDPNIIPPPESASISTDRPVSTILADSPTEPKTPLADPATDYTVATESASIGSSPPTVPDDSASQSLADPQTTVPAEAPVATQSATVPTEAQGEASPPPPPPVPEEIPATPPQSEPQVAPAPPPQSVEGSSIQDFSPSNQPSQIQPEVSVNAPSPQASQEPETAPQSAEIKPEPPQDTQNAPLADSPAEATVQEGSDSQKSSFGDFTSNQPMPISSPISPQVPQSPQTPISSPSVPSPSFGDLIGNPPVEEPTITIEPIEPPKPIQQPQSSQPPLSAEAPAKEGISPQPPTEVVVEAKADFSAKRQQALQTRRKKRDDHLVKILTLISQKGKIKNKDICDFLRVSQSTATNYLHSLVKDGKIKKEGKAKATIYLL